MKHNFVLAFGSFIFAASAVPAVSQEPPEVEYVRICDVYGEGYYYIPATEVCINVLTGEIKTETEEGTFVGESELAERIRILEEAMDKLLKEQQ